MSNPINQRTDAEAEDRYVPGPEETALQGELLDRLELCRDLDPDWYAQFEDTDVEICDRASIVHLMLTAPNHEAKLFLFGKYQFRLAIAAITDRGFK
jgi:hypothetical protein